MCDDEILQRLSKSIEVLSHGIPALKDALAESGSQYAEMKRNVEGRVTRWEWSSSLPRYDLDPLCFLDDSSRRGAASKKRPSSIRGKHEYGFDEWGRLHVERDHTDIDGYFYEQFFSYEPNRVSSTLFDYAPEKKPIRVLVCAFRERLPQALLSRATHGSSAHVYEVESGRIQHACEIHMPDARDWFGNCSKLIYLENGNVQRWLNDQRGDWVLSFTGSLERYKTFPILGEA